MVISLNDKLPIYCIFIYFLLLFVDSAKNLFPCRFRHALESNLVLKHLMTYLIFTFLVVLLEQIPNKNLMNIFLMSFYLYIVFIFISKTEYGFFVPILTLLGIIYVLYLKREEYSKMEEQKLADKENMEKKHDIIIKINNVLVVIVIILIIIGFLAYMGRKKMEYKNKFNYLTFIFGKVECEGSFSKVNYKESLKYLFK